MAGRARCQGVPEVEDLVPFHIFHGNVKYAIVHATLHRTDGVPIPAACPSTVPTHARS